MNSSAKQAWVCGQVNKTDAQASECMNKKTNFYCSNQEKTVEFNHYFLNVASKHHRYIILQTNNLNTTDIESVNNNYNDTIIL